MKWFSILLVILYWACQSPQEKTTERAVFSANSVTVDAKSLENGYEFEGRKIHHYQWSDASGQQTVIFSLSSNADSIEDADLRKATLHITWFTKANDLLTKTAVFSDGVDSCHCDCLVQLIDSLTKVNDLDKDGNGDLFVMYELQDNCDASPVAAKGVLLSGNRQLETSGRTHLYLDETEGRKLIQQYQTKSMDGYKVPFAFTQQDAPESWREYAGHVWQQYVTQEARQYYDQQQ